MQSLLKIEDLSIGYTDKILVEQINCSVNENEFVVLLGKNGIGKSTLIHSVLGFQSYQKGRILLNGLDVKQMSHKQMAQQVAVVFSKLHQVPQIKVFELLRLARIPHQSYLKSTNQTEDDLINRVLNLVGITDLKYRYANELSEGQLQLVMIARALVQDTSLLILDEPTANLDLENQLRVFELIKKLKEETNLSIVMITHDAALGLSFADKIWWIEEGRLIEDAPEDLAFQYQIIPKLSGNYLQYNQEKGLYTMMNHQYNQITKINLPSSEYIYWINKGLERLGINLSENRLDSIKVFEKNIIFEEQNFKSIYSFLNYIKQHEKHYNNRSE